MKVVSCLLMGLDAQSQAIAEVAAQSVFPDAAVTVVETIDEALKRGEVPGVELLALANPDTAVLTRAEEATDSMGLHRWAVVVFGNTPPGQTAEVVTTDEWDAARVAHVLRAAVLRHELVRENIRLKGDLLTIARRITHDLRTPIGAIVHTGEMLKEILAENDPSHDSLANPLFDSVEELGRIIGRVSLITKASSTQTPRQHVSMTEVVWAVLQRYQPQILKKQAVVVQPESWPEIEGVAPWLEAIWGNLLANALEHGKDEVRIELGFTALDKEIRFWISDNGEGVPADKLHNLFQPFHLLHRTDARKGLGLSIVRRLVELQDGQCGYVPLPSGGSTFYFTLPSESQSVAAAAHEPAVHRSAGPRTREKRV
jgi:signal transduction histidine kinase